MPGAGCGSGMRDPASGTDEAREERPRGKLSYCKGNPASSALLRNPLFGPKKRVVCTGFALRADSPHHPIPRKQDFQSKDASPVPVPKRTRGNSSPSTPLKPVPRGGVVVLFSDRRPNFGEIRP